ncbi:Hsp70 chaperone, partial [Basidiobolus ranarum]
KKLEEAINSTISWLDASQEASKDEYEEKQKELEGVANPIMTRIHQATEGVASGGFPGSDNSEPTVEELD